MHYYSLLSIIPVVLLMVANCASATLWISVLGGHRQKFTHNEGGAPEPTIRILDKHPLIVVSLWWSLADISLLATTMHATI